MGSALRYPSCGQRLFHGCNGTRWFRLRCFIIEGDAAAMTGKRT